VFNVQTLACGTPGRRSLDKKNYPTAGGWFLPSCVIGRVTAPLGFRPFSDRDCLLVVGITPTGNRDAGKFAADATQLPTGCQPESLAKPARRREHGAGCDPCERRQGGGRTKNTPNSSGQSRPLAPAPAASQHFGEIEARSADLSKVIRK